MRNLWLLFLVWLATDAITEKVSSQSLASTPDDLYLDSQSSGDIPIDDEDGEVDGSGSGSGDYAFRDISDQEELLWRFLNFSKTTISREMVPVLPQPTADSPQNPATTAADSQEQTTKVTTTRVLFPDGDEEDKEVLGASPTADWFTESTSPSSTNGISPSSTNRTSPSSTNGISPSSTNRTSPSSTNGTSPSSTNGTSPSSTNGTSPSSTNVPHIKTAQFSVDFSVTTAVIACGVVGFLCAVFLVLFLTYRMKKKDEGSYDLGDTNLSTTAYHAAPTKEFYA